MDIWNEITFACLHGLQSVERSTHNPCFVGSSYTGGSNAEIISFLKKFHWMSLNWRENKHQRFDV